ncbi:hypothetical protein V5799_006042 [Amblyomma americanum]|uniref:Ubiquitin-conjugating enzyme E2 Z n=1 Tax=Amblyomma americanum TaxID=6943 RepID=A0AAQ4DXI7_AMBAM
MQDPFSIAETSGEKSHALNLPFWDPMSCQDEEPSTPCLLRVHRDLVYIFDDPPPGVFVEPEENNITKIHAIIMGPSGTPYEGGFFHFLIKCPPDYPARPPRVRLMTTDSGRVRFNPNLYADGMVCLSILGTSPGPAWNPALNIGTVLMSIKSLLSQHRCWNEPGNRHMLRRWFGKLSGQNAVTRYETMSVAVCDAVEACLQGKTLCPPPLRHVLLETFTENYSKYERAAKNLHGSYLGSLFSGWTGSKHYEMLLKRLRDLRDQVTKRNLTPAEEGK